MATGRVPTTANSPLTAKGDLFTYSTAPARLAVGNNGEQIVADSATSTGLRYQVAKNQNGIYNSSMDIAQRGTTFTTTSGVAYTLDRWSSWASTVGDSLVTTQEAGTATSRYSAKLRRSTGNTNTGGLYYFQSLETADSYRFQGQTVTLSFYAKKGANYSAASSILVSDIRTGTGTDQIYYNYTGTIDNNQNNTLTTSWQRFTQTVTLSASLTEVSVSFLANPVGTAGADDSFFVTGIQLEVGSVATSYNRMSGTIQGELAACQRYYTTSIPTGYVITDFPIMGTTGAGGVIFTCSQGGTNDLFGTIQYPVTLRSTPTINIYSGNNRTSGSVRDMVTGTDATVSAYSAQTGQNKNFVYMGVGTFTSSRQYGFHYTASAEL